MQTLRKKTSPLKYKNETTRFLGDGVSFKAKLIGILEVSEARGDRMCQEALADLKMAIRAAGEHKQRITINIAIDGLRLRDEKTGDSLYHHPVHKISFIAQDMTDSRAFGYIFGSPDTGHRFFGIKTDKAASQVVIAMRDLFQVVFALKKKEIELAKQHLDKNRFTSSSLFLDSSVSNAKFVTHESVKDGTCENKATSNSEAKSSGTAVADLVDLELELNSLQQGLTQMERITPSDPFGSKEDPFGDSFTTYTKPILPPPPSSGRERSSRTCDVFSPKSTKSAATVDSKTSDSNSVLNKREKNDIFAENSNTSDSTTAEDWFKQSSVKNVFEDSLLISEATKEEEQEATKREILSQFDVFTELDPLGTGKNKPYVDKKHFFKELKNPPKKVLNDLVIQTQQKETNTCKSNVGSKTSTIFTEFSTDPFGEDPFVKVDPFAETDFSKQDPFEKDFANFHAKDQVDLADLENDTSNNSESLPLAERISKLQSEKQSNNLSKDNNCRTKDAEETKSCLFELNKDSKITELHQNVSLDGPSELEYVPEPPPKPESVLTQIMPPPLPPKRQGNELLVKPPPRPPHVEEAHFTFVDYISKVTGSSLNKNLNESPPLPVPARKVKYDPEQALISERPMKQLTMLTNEEDYLTPVSSNEQSMTSKQITSSDIPSTLLPPPQKAVKKLNVAQITAPSHIKSKCGVSTTPSSDSIDGLDITLSQLTLSGLNELAKRLNIPANQLNNMTLVQLTNYLSNFIKSTTKREDPVETNSNNMMPTFHVDFAANFNKPTTLTTNAESYDRYAVFRELMTEEIKQLKTDAESEEQSAANAILSEGITNSVSNSLADNDKIRDKYAALREIVENELKLTETQNNNDHANENVESPLTDAQTTRDVDETNMINCENNVINDARHHLTPPKYNLIEYNNTSMESKEVKSSNDSLKSPKSPPVNTAVKSPLPPAITEIVHNNTRLNSGSLSDAVSGSSPDIDNTGSNSELGKKIDDDVTGEPWAIFDQEIAVESIKDKQTIPSEEGISPWSSDSKEFGNSSPPVWQSRDADGNGDQWIRQRRFRKDQDGWWDTSAEPEVVFCPNRRSTDSYDDDYYECHGKHRRRKQTGYVYSAQGTGGHSSSSRDVSPWEEEPHRREQMGNHWGKHVRQRSFEKFRERRHVDSWDDDDDYEYEEEHVPRYHRSERQKWENERDRYNFGNKDVDMDKWNDDWGENRRHKCRREVRCCLDWDECGAAINCNCGRWINKDTSEEVWRSRKCNDRCYSRDSQESPWEDEYSNETEDFSTPHYSTIKKVWKRPSSASDMDRKAVDLKSRYYLAAGGSDGERERKYKLGRRSRSRDSQNSEPPYRHKSENTSSGRLPHKAKQYLKQCNSDAVEMSAKKHGENPRADFAQKKNFTLTGRRRMKESSKIECNLPETLPRRSILGCKSLFENDFVPSESTIMITENFSAEHELSESDSPKAVNAGVEKSKKQEECNQTVSSDQRKPLRESNSLSAKPQYEPRPLFEDNFFPNGKNEPDEIKSREDDFFDKRNLDSVTNSKRKKNNRQKLGNSMHSDLNIKKSESVNIFSRESDPFDDDFFSEDVTTRNTSNNSPVTSDLQWSNETDDLHTDK